MNLWYLILVIVQEPQTTNIQQSGYIWFFPLDNQGHFVIHSMSSSGAL